MKLPDFIIVIFYKKAEITRINCKVSCGGKNYKAAKSKEREKGTGGFHNPSGWCVIVHESSRNNRRAVYIS